MNNKGSLVDRKKHHLAAAPEKNPRTPISQLARRIGVSNPAVKEQLVRLEETLSRVKE